MKNDPLFRCFYKFPAYVKNIILFLTQAVFLFLIYLVFLKGDGHIYSALKILNGMTSNTFNYLTRHKEQLDVSSKIEFFNLKNDYNELDTVRFFKKCVRINKPCKLGGLATQWPAYQKWNTHAVIEKDYKLNTGVNYMKDLIGADRSVHVFDINSSPSLDVSPEQT